MRQPKSRRAGELAPPLAAELDALPGYPLSRLRPGAAAQLYGAYDFSRLALTRGDGAVDFFFGEGPPDAALPRDAFSIRWTGWIKPPFAGRYMFVTHSDDGVRLWIDGQKVCDNWNGVGWQEAVLDLTAGPHYFRLEYADILGNAQVEFGWTLAAFTTDSHAQFSTLDALYHDPDSPFELPEPP